MDNVEPDGPEAVTLTGFLSVRDSAIEAGMFARSLSDGTTESNKAKLKEMPSNGSYTTYKILNSPIAPRDSTYLLSRLKYFTQQT